jgi:hypothetical protein
MTMHERLYVLWEIADVEYGIYRYALLALVA